MKNAELTAKKVASEIVEKLKANVDKEVIIQQYLDEYWNGYIKDIYPEDAIRLNTSIMIDLLERELASKPTVD